MSEAAPAARRIVVRGKVQGVFYRDWTVSTARSLCLSGWVRNLGTGEVEILAMGPIGQVEELVRRCWEGPHGASVVKVVSEETRPEPTETFARRPSVPA